MSVNLQNYVAALKAPDVDIPIIMKAAARFWKVPANDGEFKAALKTPKDSIKWILADTDKEAIATFLALAAKKGFIEVTTERRRAPAPASRGRERQVVRGKVAKGEARTPREGSKLAIALDLMSRKNGISRAELEKKLGSGAPLWSLQQLGYEIENIGERGNAVYRIVA